MNSEVPFITVALLAGAALSYVILLQLELRKLKRWCKDHLEKDIRASHDREGQLRDLAERAEKDNVYKRRLEEAFTQELSAKLDLQKELTEARNSQTGVPVCHVRELIDAIGIPDRNCSCHTGSAPCHDCTDYGGLRHIIDDMDLDSRKEPTPSHLQALLKIHERLLEKNPYCYLEVAYVRTTGWMAWLCTNALELDKNRKVIARGQGDSIETACKDALDSIDPVESSTESEAHP